MTAAEVPGGAGPVLPPELPELPEGLLAPLLELAGDVLRALPASEVAPSARRLASFDRRGLATPAARAQLRRLMDSDDRLATAVADAYAQSPEANAALEGWESHLAPARVGEAAAGGRLPALAAALYAVRPAGWEFALGLAAATFEAARADDGMTAQMRSLEEQVATLEEAKRRAEVARNSAEAQLSRVEAELKEARRARRAGEEKVVSDLADARRRVAELEAELAEAVRRRGEAEAQARGEARRAAAEGRARQDAERAAAEAAGQPAPRPPAVDPAVMAEAAARLSQAIGEAARQADQLRALLEAGAGEPTTTPGGGRRPRTDRRRRARVMVPPGMMADTAEAAETMVRTPGLAVVVDGYNVSMLAWPDVSVTEQRQRLFGALAEFQLRVRVGVTLVFDGADVTGVRPPRRPGLTTVFSAPGQEADDLVVEEVAARPPDVPVLVVSSDAEVRSRCEAHGAQVIGSDVFLTLLRR